MSGGAVGGGPAMSEDQVALQNCLPSEPQEPAGGLEPDWLGRICVNEDLPFGPVAVAWNWTEPLEVL